MNLKLMKVQQQYEEKIRIAIEHERIHHTRMGFYKDHVTHCKEKYKRWLNEHGMEPTQKYYID